MKFGDRVCSIFSVINLCVAEDERSHGIAARLFADLKALANRGEIGVLLLLANQPDLYTSHGFHGIDAECRWLGIDNCKNVGVIEEYLSGELMIKLIGIDETPHKDPHDVQEDR